MTDSIVTLLEAVGPGAALTAPPRLLRISAAGAALERRAAVARTELN
jgi:hypothetical protein